jgi:type II secretory pathway pseudopilin PulG
LKLELDLAAPPEAVLCVIVVSAEFSASGIHRAQTSAAQQANRSAKNQIKARSTASATVMNQVPFSDNCEGSANQPANGDTRTKSQKSHDSRTIPVLIRLRTIVRMSVLHVFL